MSGEDSQKGTRMTIMVIEGLVGIAALIAGLLFIVRPDGSLLGMARGTLSDHRVQRLPRAGHPARGRRRRRDASRGLCSWPADAQCRRTVLASGAMLLLFEGVEEALIGFSPERPLIVLLGLVLIALSLRLAGPMRAAQIELAGDSVGRSVSGLLGSSGVQAATRDSSGTCPTGGSRDAWPGRAVGGLSRARNMAPRCRRSAEIPSRQRPRVLERE